MHSSSTQHNALQMLRKKYLIRFLSSKRSFNGAANRAAHDCPDGTIYNSSQNISHIFSVLKSSSSCSPPLVVLSPACSTRRIRSTFSCLLLIFTALASFRVADDASRTLHVYMQVHPKCTRRLKYNAKYKREMSLGVFFIVSQALEANPRIVCNGTGIYDALFKTQTLASCAAFAYSCSRHEYLFWTWCKVFAHRNARSTP